MITHRSHILPLCALTAVATIAVASQVMASTPVYSENFDNYSEGSDLIGQQGWKRAGFENAPTVSTPSTGINTSTALSKNSMATTGNTAASLQKDPFGLPSAGIFSYEFDVQRDAGSSCSAAVGLGPACTGRNTGPAHAGINKGGFYVRAEGFGETTWLSKEPNQLFIAIPNNWYRLKVDIDLVTKALAGIYVKDLTGGDSSISDSDFQPLILGKEGSTRTLSAFCTSDPATWDTVFVRTGEQDAEGSGWIDNISATVAPAAN